MYRKGFPMRRYRSLIQLAGVESLLLIILLVTHYFRLPLVCPFKYVTGIPCPGCGGTRVFFALLHGRFAEALAINPLSVVVIAFALAAPVWLFVDCYRGTDSLQRVMRSKWSWKTTAIVILIILANWIWNIYKEL